MMFERWKSLDRVVVLFRRIVAVGSKGGLVGEKRGFWGEER